jgi:hypothetical protein
MIVNFSTTYPRGTACHGQPTNFIDKILRGEKIHTIRDSAERFIAMANKMRPYARLHIYTGARTKNALCHAVKPFHSVQEIVFYRKPTGVLESILVDGKVMDEQTVVEIAANDGFDTVFGLVDWMFAGCAKDVLEIRKYIIHWTPQRY